MGKGRVDYRGTIAVPGSPSVIRSSANVPGYLSARITDRPHLPPLIRDTLNELPCPLLDLVPDRAYIGELLFRTAGGL